MLYYPVFIPTLNRYNHFRNCVESLAKCKGAMETELVIGLDYPPSKEYEDGYLKIKGYLPYITGFKKITIFESSYNLGPGKNAQRLKDYCFKHYDAAIGTEDDNIFAPTYLEFINSGLEFYKNNKSIMTICGYTPAFLYNYKYDGLLTHDSSAWGLGIWRDKENWPRDFEYLEKVFFSWKKMWKIYINYPLLIPTIGFMYNNKVIYGDAIRCIKNIIDKQFQFRPSISLVRNMGQDGSGLHSGTKFKERYHNQILSNKQSYFIREKTKVLKIPFYKTIFQGLPNNKIIAIKGILFFGIKYAWFRISKQNNF